MKTEGGQGGKKGHSNMTHWSKTAEVKKEAKKGRRQDDKKLARDAKSKFESFLDNMKGSGNDVLIESIRAGYKVCMESELEHTIGPYYYDSRAGKYYNKSTDMYVDNAEVDNQLQAQQNAVKINNEVLTQAFKLGLIDGKDYQRNHSRVTWDEKMSGKMDRNAKEKGISVVELYEKAKERYKGYLQESVGNDPYAELRRIYRTTTKPYAEGVESSLKMFDSFTGKNISEDKTEGAALASNHIRKSWNTYHAQAEKLINTLANKLIEQYNK